MLIASSLRGLANDRTFMHPLYPLRTPHKLQVDYLIEINSHHPVQEEVPERVNNYLNSQISVCQRTPVRLQIFRPTSHLCYVVEDN